jgi:mersacidin/lichenicidin family type 2 lantibiotic
VKSIDIIRAWKDKGYRLGLSEAERATLPANPAGFVALSEADLADVVGGQAPQPVPVSLVGSGLVLSKTTTTNHLTCNPAICSISPYYCSVIKAP